MNQFSNRCVLVAGLMGALAVALGAFGAHGLQEPLARWYPDSGAQKLATWNTAVTYQFYHALAFLALASLSGRHCRKNNVGQPSRLVQVAFWTMLIGVCIFSGLLYALVLSDVKILGAIVPVGGVLMIVGWLCLASSTFRRTASHAT
ncbi:MAG: DUF423 domain-containing protein [Pirellulaceae bacterium]|nr:DUF423 domain-containing protein [Pirellulaceae bacterium]